MYVYIYIYVYAHTHTHINICICTMEHYSAKKENEIVPFLTVWLDLESIMLTELSQTEKENYYIISLPCGISNKVIETE